MTRKEMACSNCPVSLSGSLIPLGYKAPLCLALYSLFFNVLELNLGFAPPAIYSRIWFTTLCPIVDSLPLIPSALPVRPLLIAVMIVAAISFLMLSMKRLCLAGSNGSYPSESNTANNRPYLIGALSSGGV